MAGLGIHRLDQQWKAIGQQHEGIIVSPRILDLGELLRRAIWRLDPYTPAPQHDTLLWLSPSPSP